MGLSEEQGSDGPIRSPSSSFVGLLLRFRSNITDPVELERGTLFFHFPFRELAGSATRASGSLESSITQ